MNMTRLLASKLSVASVLLVQGFRLSSFGFAQDKFSNEVTLALAFPQGQVEISVFIRDFSQKPLEMTAQRKSYNGLPVHDKTM